jgi:hypothetical protein
MWTVDWLSANDEVARIQFLMVVQFNHQEMNNGC